MTTVALAVFAASLLGFLAVLSLVDRAVSAERRRFNKRMERAASAGRRYTQPAAVPPRLRKADNRRDQPLAVRIAASVIPGYDHLEKKIGQSGLRVAPPVFVLTVLAAVAVTAGVLRFLVGFPWPLAGALGAIAGVSLPYGFLRWRAYKRAEKLLAQMPDALDAIARGLRSGIPLMETIEIVARDFESPLREQFATIRDQTRVGTALDAALWGVANDLRLQEFNFFAISVSIQRETGGNLTENLQNLSRVLREREAMKRKVKAISSEARASAYILGSLPFAVAAVISVMNPEYIARLFDAQIGLMLVGGALILMTIGVLVMIRMVNFEI